MQSVWFQIAAVFGDRLEALAGERACSWLENPPLPLDLRSIQQQRALFLVQRGDRLIDQPGQVREKRRVRLLVGAVALTKTSLADADDLHLAARERVRGDAFRTALRSAGAIGPVREVEVEPELKDIAAEGSALISAFEIEYFQDYPNAG